MYKMGRTVLIMRRYKERAEKLAELAFKNGVAKMRNQLCELCLKRHKPFKEGSVTFNDIVKIANKLLK